MPYALICLGGVNLTEYDVCLFITSGYRNNGIIKRRKAKKNRSPGPRWSTNACRPYQQLESMSAAGAQAAIRRFTAISARNSDWSK